MAWFLLAPPVVGAVLLMVAAVWRPTAVQWVLLLAGPALLTASLLGTFGRTDAGWVAVVTPLVYVLVPATLPWRRPWARWAVPVVTLGTAALWYGRLVADASTRRGLLVGVGALAVVALTRAVAAGRTDPGAGRGRPGTPVGGLDAVEPHWAPTARSLVVGVAAVQALVGALAVVVGLGLPSWASRITDSATGPRAVGVAAVALVVAGVVAVPLYAGLAVGLSRGYRRHRPVLVVAQFALALTPLLLVQAAWVLVPLALGVATAVLALVTPPPPWDEGADADDPAASHATVS